VENDLEMEEDPVLVPSEIHYQYSEYLKSEYWGYWGIINLFCLFYNETYYLLLAIPWSDQIDEMEELAKLLSKETQLGGGYKK
jgi:hypothetical protein